jgi:hypothetical protein
MLKPREHDKHKRGKNEKKKKKKKKKKKIKADKTKPLEMDKKSHDRRDLPYSKDQKMIESME